MRLITSKNYDRLNQISALSHHPSTDSVSSFAYQYNAANQRTRRTEPDSSYWFYSYDSLGQVISGKKYWSDGTPVAGQQFEYAFDDIGNRSKTKAGGDQTGAGLRVANYTANDLNQYSQRDIPGVLDVLGVARGNVTANGNTAYRKGEYFRSEVSVNNSSAAQYQSVNVTSTDGTSVSETGAVFIAKTPEVFGHDLDGNLTNDGRWTMTWDAENRLIQIESLSTAPQASKRKVAWQFDAQGRRIRQTTYDGSSGSYSTTEDLKFISDGWRHIAELNATNDAVIRSYTWGLDLSGSLGGTGGVGGLLFLSTSNSQPSSHFYGYDGNGNVTLLINATNGTASAVYEYDPFGRELRATGPMADENTFTFSTKRRNATTRLVLYEYRPYDADEGRWLGRDKMNENASRNLYGFVDNDPENFWDAVGTHKMPSQPGPLPPPSPGPDTFPLPPGECRVQICCKPAIGPLLPPQHCFIRFDSESTTEACRGGPSRRRYGPSSSGSPVGNLPPNCTGCRGYWGTVNAGCGDSGSVEEAGDLTASGQTCTTVIQGPEACALLNCFRQRMAEINGRCVKYRPLGPNSNSAAGEALRSCMPGPWASPPLGAIAPGWQEEVN